MIQLVKISYTERSFREHTYRQQVHRKQPFILFFGHNNAYSLVRGVAEASYNELHIFCNVRYNKLKNGKN